MEVLFWIGGVGALYSYLIYPLLLLLIPVRRTITPTAVSLPSISFVVTAHNEAARIGAKLENTMAVDYPRHLLEIVVVSDGSTDATDDIVAGFAASGVRLLRPPVRRGKEFAQRHAIRHTRGEVLVFSDVATLVEPAVLRRLAGHFAAPEVGAVSSVDRYLTPDGRSAGEGVYVRYEMWLRRLESTRAGLVGLSGSLFAARRAVCHDWNIAVPSDFNTALNCRRLGLRAVSAEDVVGTYQAIVDEGAEYRRKWRTVLRGMSALLARPEALNPWRYGLFAFQLFSHKPMRWAVPWFLLLCLLTSVAVAPNGPFYGALFILQVVLYALVVAGAFSRRLRVLGPVRIPYYFVAVNAAIAHAALSLLAGKRVTLWQPSRR